MYIFNEIKFCKDKVEFILQKYPECKDDDKKLLAYYQYFALGLEDIITLDKWYERTRFAELPAHESVTRARRKLQENKPHLRGENYSLRHGEGEFIKQNAGNL